MPDEPNPGLVGYRFTNVSDGGSVWYVKGTDPILGRGYVLLFRQGTLGVNPHDRRVMTAGAIARRKEIEEDDGA